MKKILLTFFILFYIPIASATLIESGISVDHVPKDFFGSWRVNAKLDSTNAPSLFRPQSIDFWNLSRVGDVLKLDNPYSGANAEISVQTVENNLIVFSKKLAYDNNKVLTDTVTLRLNGNKFTGINTLVLETFSLIDKTKLKTEMATYHINGEKISGENLLND